MENNAEDHQALMYLLIYPQYDEDEYEDDDNEEVDENERALLYNNMMNYMLDYIENSIIDNVTQRSIEDYELSKKDNVKTVLEKTEFSKLEKTDIIDCSICKENYKNTDFVVVLNCKHIIHCECLDEWVKYKPVCPLCREEIPHIET